MMCSCSIVRACKSDSHWELRRCHYASLRRMLRSKNVVQQGSVFSDKHLASPIVSANKREFFLQPLLIWPVKRNRNYVWWLEGGWRWFRWSISTYYTNVSAEMCASTIGGRFCSGMLELKARPESGHRRVVAAFAETCQLRFPFRTYISYSSRVLFFPDSNSILLGNYRLVQNTVILWEHGHVITTAHRQ